MISSQRAANQPSRYVIQELIRLFEIYIEGPEGCRQRSYRLLEQYPRTPIVIEIAAACDSLTGKYSEAIAGYQKCLEITPKTLAYTNNQAWNFIQLKDYEIAMTLLSQIKDKWNHPAIYSNWATVLQNIGQNREAVEQTIRKRDDFLRNYPQYRRQGNNQLIHTFLLKSDDNYTAETEEFRTEVFELVEVLRRIQRAPVSFQTLRERLQFMKDKINLRKFQKQKSGFIIDPSFKIALAGLELLQTKILNNYQEKYSEELKKYVLKSIEFINDHLFSEKIGEKFDYKSFQESKLTPTVYQIIEIGQYMQQKLEHLTGVQRHHAQQMHQSQEPKQIHQQKPMIIEQKPERNSNIIQLQQPSIKDKINEMHNQINVLLQKINDSQKISEANKKSEEIKINEPIVQISQKVQTKQQQKPAQIQIQDKKNDLKVASQQEVPKDQQIQKRKRFTQNKEDIEIDKEDKLLSNEENGYHFCIRLEEIEQMQREKAQHLVEKLRIEGQTQANPLFVVLRFRQNTKDTSIVYVNPRRINQQVRRQPGLLHLQRLTSQTQKAQVQRYYFILKNILKFYNFYGTRNFSYERKSVKSHLDCYHYFEIIAPVLNHIFEDENHFSNYKVGNICQKIHSIICNYINETRKKGDFLRSFNRILKRVHEIVQKNEKPVENLLQSLLGQKNLEYSSILLNDQLINVDGSTKYHEYYIHRMNKNRDVNSNENWLIFNISILIISTLEANEDSQSLQKRFLDCYYSSRVTQPLRNLILKNFFNANHKVPLIEKVSLGFRNIFTKILP